MVTSSPDRSISVAGHELGVLHTPGHSPGCCCFHDVDTGDVFTGDTLFCGGPGATGRSYSDEPTILRSIIASLLALPDQTVVHTGHGDSTTIGAERDGVLARAADLGLESRTVCFRLPVGSSEADRTEGLRGVRGQQVGTPGSWGLTTNW